MINIKQIKELLPLQKTLTVKSTYNNNNYDYYFNQNNIKYYILYNIYIILILILIIMYCKNSI